MHFYRFSACVFLSALIVNAAGPAQRLLSFEPNQGQSNSQVRFLARGSGYTLFLTAREAVFAPRSAGTLRMRFLGANSHSAIAGEQQTTGRSNYLIGNDASKWLTDVPNYATVRYTNVYRNVDLVYYGNQGQLEHDFIVAPGGDPNAIRLRMDGMQQMTMNDDGDLTLLMAGQKVRLLRPRIYQREGDEQKIVEGGYVLRSRHEVGFQVGSYDHQKPLVIDPVVVFYSSFLGGNNEDIGNAIAVDAAGNAYITGSTGSTNFPLRGAVQTAPPVFQDVNVFISKVNPAGSALVYSTYLGGNGADIGYGVAVDSSGAVTVAGATDSTNFPLLGASQTTARGNRDAFVAKLNPAGSALVYSTYLGGEGEDSAYAIALDPQGNAYLTGETHSISFPVLNAFQSKFGSPDDPRFGNAFVSKFSATGTLVYSTHLGSGGVGASGIAVDSAGNAFVTGISNGTFPTTAGAFLRDACCVMVFATKLNPQGSSLVYSTYVGPWGGPVDFGRGGIAIDSLGNAYVTGRTDAADFPTTAGAFQRSLGNPAGTNTDAFVTKLNPSGTALIYATFLGGKDQDEGLGIGVDSIGNAFVTGFTRSGNFPVLGASQSASGGGACTDSGSQVPCSDAFITQLNPLGTALVTSTYLGGNKDDQGRGIAVDTVGYAYLTGVTQSTNFPTLNPFQAQYADVGDPTSDAFVVKLIEPPTINAGGTVNGASFVTGGAVAPGSITSVFGVKLAPLSVATTIPLPTTLGGLSLRFNNNLATPLFFTSPVQNNIQVPWELTGQTTAMLAATVAGLTGPAISVPLAPFAPGIFTTNQSGGGQGAIQIANTVIFAAPAGSIPGVQTRPANKSEFLTIYCTGLGDVSNRPASGAAALGTPLSSTLTSATVTIGGVPATVSFAGLSPGFVGLYQVNAQVPDGSPSGGAVPLIIRIGGAASNTVTIAVQ